MLSLQLYNLQFSIAGFTEEKPKKKGNEVEYKGEIENMHYIQ